MTQLNRTVACLVLTVVCLIGIGLAELAKLGDTEFVAFFGFIASGICTLVQTFIKEEEDEIGNDKEEE